MEDSNKRLPRGKGRLGGKAEGQLLLGAEGRDRPSIYLLSSTALVTKLKIGF
jgi:hypothetical protein